MPTGGDYVLFTISELNGVDADRSFLVNAPPSYPAPLNGNGSSWRMESALLLTR